MSYQNEGYIEIKDGSIWRKVVEETWNKIRQKMLCQHLGFQETVDNSIEKRSLRNSQNIATGDLICYATTQPSGTSCCVHELQPSASTSSFRIPHVKCKYGLKCIAGTKFRVIFSICIDAVKLNVTLKTHHYVVSLDNHKNRELQILC